MKELSEHEPLGDLGALPVTGTRKAVQVITERWFPIAAVCAVANSAVAMVLALRSGNRVSFADESDYWSLARNISAGHGFTMDGIHASAFRPPGFPLLLSVVAWARSDLMALRTFNALLAGIVVLLAAILARRLAGRLVAALSAIVLAVSPVPLFTATKLYPQTFASLLMLTSLLLVLSTQDTEGRRPLLFAGGAGLAMSALTLTVPNHGATLVVAVAWLLWRGRRRALPAVAILLCTFVLPIAIWSIRNHTVFDRFVPVSTNGGINLLLGNSEGAGPNTGVNVDISRYVNEVHRRGLDEAEADRYFQQQATEWIRADPLRAAKLYIGKFINTFAITQELATKSQNPSRSATVLIGLTYLPLLILSLLRQLTWRRFPFRPGEGLVAGVFWINVAVGALAFTRLRFRVPLDPLMTILAMSFLGHLLHVWLLPRSTKEPATQQPISEESHG